MGICYSQSISVLLNFSNDVGKKKAITSAPLQKNTSEENTEGMRRINNLETIIPINKTTTTSNCPMIKSFTFAQLRKSTGRFNPANALGEGGFGMVYKGYVNKKTMKPSNGKNRVPVAVKKLNLQSVQGFKEWKSEIDFLGSLSHPNLVKLLGYCWEGKEHLLVYEYMTKGSLENHLFPRQGLNKFSLSWDLRLKIAIDAARGLTFLHTTDPKIIYRDFKSSNILLDEDYVGRISDFGLAKLGPIDGESHVSTQVMGTIGYAAPEYILTGHLYVKSDVYGYGVVLLELLSGRRALVQNQKPQNIIDWARPMLSNRKFRLANFMDPRLKGNYPLQKVTRVASLALQCVDDCLDSRPSMKDVLEGLKNIQSSNNSVLPTTTSR
ncbi:Protein kinase [Zostera marina]|uniref:non-specific serine/threonine protein kinase n=1 Tax=Zostera marina TaxID=29655 RepID=A0A0K9PFU0_ZOSMR|nr:Protein kinase [Zostera marina]